MVVPDDGDVVVVRLARELLVHRVPAVAAGAVVVRDAALLPRAGLPVRDEVGRQARGALVPGVHLHVPGVRAEILLGHDARRAVGVLGADLVGVVDDVLVEALHEVEGLAAGVAYVGVGGVRDGVVEEGGGAGDGAHVVLGAHVGDPLVAPGGVVRPLEGVGVPAVLDLVRVRELDALPAPVVVPGLGVEDELVVHGEDGARHQIGRGIVLVPHEAADDRGQPVAVLLGQLAELPVVGEQVAVQYRGQVHGPVDPHVVLAAVVLERDQVAGLGGADVVVPGQIGQLAGRGVDAQADAEQPARVAHRLVGAHDLVRERRGLGGRDGLARRGARVLEGQFARGEGEIGQHVGRDLDHVGLGLRDVEDGLGVARIGRHVDGRYVRRGYVGRRYVGCALVGHVDARARVGAHVVAATVRTTGQGQGQHRTEHHQSQHEILPADETASGESIAIRARAGIEIGRARLNIAGYFLDRRTIQTEYFPRGSQT